MAVQPIRMKRGGIEKTAQIGTNAEGKSRLNITNTLPDEHDQQVQIFPKKLVIEFDDTEGLGELCRVETVWKAALVGNNGKIIRSTITDIDPDNGKFMRMLTNEADKLAFTAMFGNPILMSMLNGFVRSIMGFNDKPVFNASGQVVTYTEAQENEPATFDYDALPTPPTNPA
jgi:hypothetical protein